jgi:hypothetical protein
LGNDFNKGPLQGKTCSRRILHASKEKGCQEKEALTVKRDEFVQTGKFRKASREKHLSRGFLLDSQDGGFNQNVFGGK